MKDTLLKAARRFRAILIPPPVILLYHRVAHPACDPHLLSVCPKNFEEQLKVLARHFNPITLAELIDAIRGGKIPRRAVVVTFDDGYADNLHNAKPALEKYGIPATVFVASGYLGSKKHFWWDEAERILLHPGRLKRELALEIGGTRRRWDLGSAAHYSQGDFDSHRAWNILRPDVPTRRQQVFLELCQAVRLLDLESREDAMSQLRHWAADCENVLPDCRAMTEEELLKLVEGGIIQAGAHTVDHPRLSSLVPEEQKAQIQNGKARMEAVLRRPIDTFAYPFGSRTDYNEATLDIVKKSGFSGVCSNFPGRVHRGADLYQMPRFMVMDWSGQQFENKLRSFLEN